MARLLFALPFVVCHTLVATSFCAAADVNELRIAELRITQQLSESTELECAEYLIREILDYIGELHGIPVSIDKAEIKRAGIDLRFRGGSITTTIRLDEALTKILEPGKLSFMIDDGKLLITSQEKAKAWQEGYAKSRKRE